MHQNLQCTCRVLVLVIKPIAVQFDVLVAVAVVAKALLLTEGESLYLKGEIFSYLIHPEFDKSS